MDPRRAFGDRGERLAETYLTRRGFVVVARNARTRWGEIDLVCRDGSDYLFVEVKTRRASSFVAAAEAVTVRKRARLERLALSWLAAQGLRAVSWRLAVCAITVGAAGRSIELLDA